MIEYVAGFMFNKERTKVGLILKNRPDWQKGKLNGIGGKINEGEADWDAMVREFEEETGLKTFYYDWKPLANLKDIRNEWRVGFFYCDTLLESLEVLESKTDEIIQIVDVANIDNEPVITNLKWLIKMCLDKNHHYAEVTSL